MAGPHGWVGDSSGDFGDALAWDTGLVPGDAEGWFADRSSVGPMTAGLNQSAKTFSRITIHSGCAVSIASAASPLQCGVTDLIYAGQGNVAAFQGTANRLYVVKTAQNIDAFVFDGVFTDLVIDSGTVRLAGTRTITPGGRIHLGRDAIAGEALPTLTIPGTTTLTSVEMMVNGGTLSTLANLPDTIMGGGEIILDRDATYDPTLTLLQASGGAFRWRSTGTITRVELAGDAHFWNEYDLPKTLTAMSVYDSAVADLRDSHHLTLTTGIRQFGNASAMLGRGETAGVV